MKRSGPPARKTPMNRGSLEVARAWRERSAAKAQENAAERARVVPPPGHRERVPPRPRRTLAARSRPEEPGKAEAVKRWRIAVLGAGDSRLDPHHVIPKQVLKRIARTRGLKGPAFWAVVYDPRVGVPLPRQQHEAHTTRARQIPREHLPHSRMRDIRAAIEEYGPEAERAFAIEHPPLAELRARR